MKNFISKIFIIFAFILTFALSTLGADLNINSITYDNSGTFLAINSFDNDVFSFEQLPKLYVVQEENKAYFDISSAILKCSAQDIVINNPEIKEIIVKQHSLNPNIVRVIISYNEGFNPKNIQLKRLNNLLFIRFKSTAISNYYFQHIYSDLVSSVQEFYEGVTVQVPVLANQSMVNQINSAFKLGETTQDKNYILTKKDLVLPTKYYIDDINVKNDKVFVYGIGSYTLTKPFVLQNPSRIVYDIPNAYLNPSFRNKDVYINQTDSIRVGQFDKRTVRLVITSQNPDVYIPVINADAQKLVFVNKNSENFQNILLPKTVLRSINDEINDKNTHTLKFIFTKPVVYTVQRNSLTFDLSFYNAERPQELELKSSNIFEGAKLTNLPNGGLKYSFPIDSDDNIDIHTGLDGKTIRLRLKSNKLNLPKPAVSQPPVNISDIITPKKNTNGKIYIVLDPGHGGSDCGALRNKIYEKDITLDISKRVEKLLEKKGYEVFMTRTTDETVSLQERVEISENIQPDAFISIHVNSSNSSTPKGLETHYYKDNSLVLAKTLHASMLNHINAANRGLFKSKFYVINHTTAPAVLVEIGFISNDSERAQLVTENRKQATAKAIAEGIDDYFKKQ